MSDINTILTQLTATIESRRTADAGSSYVAKLFAKGDNAVLKKIAEEAGEVIIAAKDAVQEEIVYESADLVFHLMVMLAQHQLTFADVVNELARREGVSGIVEKASRALD